MGGLCENSVIYQALVWKIGKASKALGDLCF